MGSSVKKRFFWIAAAICKGGVVIIIEVGMFLLEDTSGLLIEFIDGDE